MSNRPRERFSDRVEDYVRARPTYPAEAIRTFGDAAGLDRHSIVADVGAGTGISTALLLAQGWDVIALEPNAAMRSAMEDGLGAVAGFRSLPGSAENTGLPDGSVDAIFAAQAFHWFEPAKAAREFRRILRRPASVGLIWNTRSVDASPFLRGYEALLARWGTDYAKIRHRNIETAEIHAFLGPEADVYTFPNHQELDLDGLTSRLLSSSYTPPADSPDREPMLRELRELFEAHNENGMVSILYECELHVGRWK